jgi:uncharacterized protein (DUF1330 family)
MPKTHWSGGADRASLLGMTQTRRYYQLVFIWLRDLAMFQRYLQLARPVVERYGGALERMLAPTSVSAENVTKPDIVNVVYYEDEFAYYRMNGDPEFREVVPLRSQSIDMLTIEGNPREETQSLADLAREDLGRRLYRVEIVRFGTRGAGGYRAYEEASVPILEEYGYRVERTLSVDSASRCPFQPDLVKIAYFDRRDGLARVEQDARHRRLERDLYPAIVAQSMLLLGEVHPMSIGEPR